MCIHHRRLYVVLCCIAFASCSKAPTPADTEKRTQEQVDKMTAEQEERERRIQEQVDKIAAERARLAELQQDAREKMAADLASRTDTREARRLANLEHAAAEQARREGITAELKSFVDNIWVERSQMNNVQILRMNGYPVKWGSVLVSPAGYSVKFTKEDGDYFWFAYDEEAFSLTLKKTTAGLSIAEAKSKQPLAEGFQVDQKLPETISESSISMPVSALRGLTVLKATYGAGQTQRDVKDLVKSKIQNGRLNFRAGSHELGGDPIFGQSKTFYIKYLAGGRVMERSFREGEQVSLP